MGLKLPETPTVIKKHPVRTIMLGLVGSILAIWFAAWFFIASPLKVKDPHDSRFDPYKFRFHDYFGEELVEGQKALREAVEIMFPPGTPRSYVEEIFAKDDVRYYVRQQNANIVRYADKPWLRYPGACSSSVITIEYDDDNKVREIESAGFACDPLGWAAWDAGTPLISN